MLVAQKGQRRTGGALSAPSSESLLLVKAVAEEMQLFPRERKSIFFAEDGAHDQDKGNSANTHDEERFGRDQFCGVHF